MSATRSVDGARRRGSGPPTPGAKVGPGWGRGSCSTDTPSLSGYAGLGQAWADPKSTSSSLGWPLRPKPVSLWKGGDMRQQRDTGKDSCVIFKGEGASWATNSPRPGGPRPLPSNSPTWEGASSPGPPCPLLRRRPSRGCCLLGMGVFVPDGGLGAALPFAKGGACGLPLHPG